MRSYKNGFKRFVVVGLVLLMTISPIRCGNKFVFGFQKVSASESDVETESDMESIDMSISDNSNKNTDAVPVSDASQSEEESGMKDVWEVDEEFVDTYEEKDNNLTLTQRNSINMLNYMSALTQKINNSSGNQMYLEEVYSSLVNDIYPNAVDTKTQAQITDLMDTIENYRMIAVKRERLEYLYEQNRAQALRQAIPNPVGLLSAVQSGSMLKSAVSILYMAVDSASSYKAAALQEDLQYQQEDWELEDQESSELHDSTKNALTYMLNMVRDYDFDGDYALSEEAIGDFAKWSEKPDSQLISKIEWFQAHEDTYRDFGSYWLELVRDYYNSEDYMKCLEAIHRYESVSTRIYRKDIDKANVLPMVITSAKEILDDSEYIKTAEQYCREICDNTKDSDWDLRYFAAQIYMDLYSLTENEAYLNSAYEIAFNNVNVLVDEQRTLNTTYMEEVHKVKSDKKASKREKKEVKKYNKLLEAERKIALPPVSESLYLNADLLFALAEKIDISEEEQSRIEAILHENGDSLFLTQMLDNRFWFGSAPEEVSAEEIKISFGKGTLTIPATCVTDRSSIRVTVSGSEQDTVIDDWTVEEVKRPKKSKDCSEFTVSYESKAGKDYKYQDGENVTIEVIPVAETPDKSIIFKYNVKPIKKFFIFPGTGFERKTK